MTLPISEALSDSAGYAGRHIGPGGEDLAEMLAVVGVDSLEQLIEETIPAAIRADIETDIETDIGCRRGVRQGQQEPQAEQEEQRAEQSQPKRQGEQAEQERQALKGAQSLPGLGLSGSLTEAPPAPLPEAISEPQLLAEMRRLASANQLFRSYIGLGYYGCITPSVIQRSILENPGWYTQYTPYQSEISQGRLEALLNYQTMVSELTGMEIANASLLDEATAAAEAMAMFYRLCSPSPAKGASAFFVSSHCFPQTIELLRNRSEPLGIELVVGEEATFQPDRQGADFFGMLLQYPNAEGEVWNYNDLIAQARDNGIAVAVAADLLALTLLEPPKPDVMLGSTQRFGVPPGYGGPHAAYFAASYQYRRAMPGRLVGLSVDAEGNPAYRLALQTREQHIRRERATSNICTAQALLAIMAGMYALYHGPEGLKRIALRVHAMATLLAEKITAMGIEQRNQSYFDTLKLALTKEQQERVRAAALKARINFCYYEDGSVGIALDETVSSSDVEEIAALFARALALPPPSSADPCQSDQSQLNPSRSDPSRSDPSQSDPSRPASSHFPMFPMFPKELERRGRYLEHRRFHCYHTETAMLRYIRRLEGYDLALNRSMIPLGSCTMKLNPTSAMMPLSWPKFNALHPFIPTEQAAGYQQIFRSLSEYLASITGLPGVSLQPNSGAQGEYSGLMVIRAYHRDRGELERDIALIPSSAHGTNPASAAMAGMQVVVVACRKDGSVDLQSLKEKAQKLSKRIACLMITYPSTHGVFEQDILEICRIVHETGGAVYMDGANMNALVGLVIPAQLGVDVCHLNLHKTFSIPHGGGGPGMGPLCVAERFIPYLPSHPFLREGSSPKDGLNGNKSSFAMSANSTSSASSASSPNSASSSSSAIPAVSAAPWGSASILTISYAYIRMLGGAGLAEVSRYAILNANYLKSRLEMAYPLLYAGEQGRVAHELILDMRPFQRFGIGVDDVAKRLIDYGFHAPTMSWPVAGTLMIEPTESEDKKELDRFCDAMLAIREEIRAVEEGHVGSLDNPLKNAPHTAQQLCSSSWDHPYSRQEAAYPLEGQTAWKFWPPVARVDNGYGDRNLFCSCPSPQELQERQERLNAEDTAEDSAATDIKAEAGAAAVGSAEKRELAPL